MKNLCEVTRLDGTSGPILVCEQDLDRVMKTGRYKLLRKGVPPRPDATPLPIAGGTAEPAEAIQAAPAKVAAKLAPPAPRRVHKPEAEE